MPTVGDVVKGRSFTSAEPDQTVFEVARLMAEKEIGAVPILEGNRLIGIFSERDMVKRVIVPGKDVHKTIVRDVMTGQLIVSSASEEIQTVLQRMQETKCRHMPVVAGDRVIGFLSVRDLLSADLKEKDAIVQELNTYIYYMPPTMPND
jgi:CBS domain-containing protein